MTYNIWNLFFAVATVEFSFAVFAKRHEFILAANAEEAIDQLAKYSLLDRRYYVYIRKLLLEYGIFELFSINVKITVATAKIRYISFNINISLTLPIILLCIYFVTAITRFAHAFNKLF